MNLSPCDRLRRNSPTLPWHLRQLVAVSRGQASGWQDLWGTLSIAPEDGGCCRPCWRQVLAIYQGRNGLEPISIQASIPTCPRYTRLSSDKNLGEMRLDNRDYKKDCVWLSLE